MAKLDASAARIEAGALRPIKSDDISEAIREARGKYPVRLVNNYAGEFRDK